MAISFFVQNCALKLDHQRHMVAANLSLLAAQHL